jgi:hypothetical protein
MADKAARADKLSEQGEIAAAIREYVASIKRHEEKQSSEARRTEIGKHLMMLGNLAAGALLFGQAFSGYPFDTHIAFIGVVTWIVVYAAAIAVMRGGEAS